MLSLGPPVCYGNQDTSGEGGDPLTSLASPSVSIRYLTVKSSLISDMDQYQYIFIIEVIGIYSFVFLHNKNISKQIYIYLCQERV